jgi:hypothetical protein
MAVTMRAVDSFIMALCADASWFLAPATAAAPRAICDPKELIAGCRLAVWLATDARSCADPVDTFGVPTKEEANCCLL